MSDDFLPPVVTSPCAGSWPFDFPLILPQGAVDEDLIVAVCVSQPMDLKQHNYVAIVDDDESLCRSLSRLLRTAGFQPVSYSSAEEFLADSKRPAFDCLLLDIQMDGISGLELRRRLSSVNDQTPVIFITAHDSPETKAEAIASGCAGYFRKTESGEVIIEAITNAISREPGNHRTDADEAATPQDEN